MLVNNVIAVCLLLFGLCLFGLWFEEEFVEVDDFKTALMGAREFDAKFVSMTSTSTEIHIVLKATEQYPKGTTFRTEGEYKLLIYTFE